MKNETINNILKFRDDRNWKQFHNPKDLAISISLEASELLELFQWSGEDVTCMGKIEKIKEELADVISYCVLMADACDLDLDEIEEGKGLYALPALRFALAWHSQLSVDGGREHLPS